AFVLDFPSLQFSSSRTPLKNVFRLPPSTLVTLTRHSAPTEELFPKESYQLVENNLSLEDAASQLKETLQNILQWHLAKGKTVATELSGGLDSSFVASFLADLSPKPIEALMYAYRKHPSHKFSEECAQIVARKKQINLRVFDSSEVPSVNLAEAAPYQNEPVDFFWQGALFGPICREFVKPDSLLITGFGCDQILMRNNQVLQLLARKKGIVASLPWVREVARSVNRPAANFTLQFLISRMPPGFLVRLLDSTRRMKINPFKIDELLPEVTRTDRVDWFIKEGKPLSSALLWNLTQAEKHWESRVFEADLPHSNLNYLVAPQYVIQPYLEFQGVEYVHPFCDFRMIDFVYTQIPFQFIHDFSRPYKNLLRQAMLNITPEEVRNRKRDEFSFDGYFFSVLKANEELLRDFLRSACDDFSDWIDRRGIFRSFESMLFGVFSNSETKLARLLSYLVWKHHFKNTLPSDQRTVQ
ncbi:MAG: asparagine synthetase B family protein, partial [Proteobacteria bacterium]|nr:asparagine synthetase B family protein [Pseudomonadota bacterium]